MEYKIKTRCTYDYVKHAQRRHSFLLIVDCPTAMVKNARCAVGCCDNDKRYSELQVKRSHVETLVFHKWPKDPVLAETCRAVARALIGGGGIFIYSGSARLVSFEIKLISKEVSRAEPEYMNIHPTPTPTPN